MSSGRSPGGGVQGKLAGEVWRAASSSSQSSSSSSKQQPSRKHKQFPGMEVRTWWRPRDGGIEDEGGRRSAQGGCDRPGLPSAPSATRPLSLPADPVRLHRSGFLLRTDRFGLPLGVETRLGRMASRALLRRLQGSLERAAP